MVSDGNRHVLTVFAEGPKRQNVKVREENN